MFRNVLPIPALFFVAQAFPKLPPSHLPTLPRPNEPQHAPNEDETLLQPKSTELKEHAVSNSTPYVEIGTFLRFR